MLTTTISGTKGKTTIVNVLSDLFSKILTTNEKILKTTNEEVVVFDKNKNFIQIDRKETFKKEQLIPSVCPGRFLTYRYQYRSIKYSFLENSIGSLKYYGTGVKMIDISILTNVYNDHIDDRNLLISKKLELVLDNNSKGNVLFLNDNQCIKKFLKKYNNKEYGNKKFFFLIHKENSQYRKKLGKIGKVGIIDNNKLIIKDHYSINLSNGFKLNLNGQYEVGDYILSTIIGYLILLKDMEYLNVKFDYMLNKLKGVEFKENYGRVNIIDFFKTNIIVDFSHEPNSIRQIINLANKIKKKDGEVYLITRGSYCRTNQQIKELGRFLGDKLKGVDYIKIYDKFDGTADKEFKKYKGEIRKKGTVSKIISNEIKKYRDCDVLLNRFNLFKRTYKQATPKDIIVFIAKEPKKDTLKIKKILLELN